MYTLSRDLGKLNSSHTPPPPPPRLIKWPPSSAKFEIAPRALIRGFTGFSFLPAASKEKQATEKQVS